MSRLAQTQPTTSAAALLQQLRAMKQRAEDAQIESSMARERWLDAVHSLLQTMRHWLHRAIDEGLARADAGTVLIADDLGEYEAPALQVMAPGGRVVWIRPVGTLRVGARGIVDMVCGSNRSLVVLNRAGTWKVRASTANSRLVPLDENTFASALGELLL